MMVLTWLGCHGGPDESPVAAATWTTPPTLPLPEIEGIDWDTSFAEALEVLVGVDARVPWASHVQALALGTPGCPDYYLGAPDPEGDIDLDAGGTSWMDSCAGSPSFAGFGWWSSSISIEGDPSQPEGQATDASRTLEADATVTDGDELWLEIDGTIDDAVNRTIAPGYDHWTYTSTLDATLGGSIGWGEDSALPGGLRTDLYLFATGGDVTLLEARGNIYLPEHRLAARFDSLSVDAAFTGSTGAAPDACTLEPAGYLSLRDEQAFWYDLVFLPRYEDDASEPGGTEDPYGACDGCGTLYIRGVEQPQITVCPDFSSMWALLYPPDPAAYVFTVRDPTSEEGT